MNNQLRTGTIQGNPTLALKVKYDILQPFAEEENSALTFNGQSITNMTDEELLLAVEVCGLYSLGQDQAAKDLQEERMATGEFVVGGRRVGDLDREQLESLLIDLVQQQIPC